jgi:ELWxxDGT repeat protein
MQGFGDRNVFAVAGDKIFILSSSFINGVSELWVSDGTVNGTKVIQTFDNDGDPHNMLAIGDRVYFPARDPEHGFELWTSTGTTESTVLVKDIRAGSGDSMRFVTLPNNRVTTDFATDGKRLFFTANDGIHGPELWTSDAMPSGTKLVEDIFPGKAGPWPQQMFVHGKTLLFSATDPVHGRELWQLPLA